MKKLPLFLLPFLALTFNACDKENHDELPTPPEQPDKPGEHPDEPDEPNTLPEEAKFSFKVHKRETLNGITSPVAAPFDWLSFRMLDHQGEYTFPNNPKFIDYYDSIVASSPNMPDTHRIYWTEVRGSAMVKQYTSQWTSCFFEKTDFPLVLKGYKDGEVIYETSETLVMRERNFLCIDWEKGDIAISNPRTNYVSCVLDKRWEFYMVDTQVFNGTPYTTIYVKEKENVGSEERKAGLRWLLRKHLGYPSTVAQSDFKTLPEGIEIIETYQNETTCAALVFRPEDDYRPEESFVIAEGK